MSFLPDNYNIPTNNRYMRFEEGDNVFRILGSSDKGTVALGWEYWVPNPDDTSKNKPVRSKTKDAKLAKQAVINDWGNKDIRHFWAFPVYNHNTNTIQFLEVTQAVIQRGIEQYVGNPKWGEPSQYDFVVTYNKNERPMYSVGVNPKEKLDPAVLEEYNNMTIDIEEWMNGGHPFETQEPNDSSLADDFEADMKENNKKEIDNLDDIDF